MISSTAHPGPDDLASMRDPVLDEWPPVALRCRDAAVGRTLRREGYFRGPSLSVTELDELRSVWASVDPGAVDGFYSNIGSLPAEVNERVEIALHRIMEPVAAAIFEEHRLTGHAFLVKGAGGGGEKGLHQDWNMVDESEAVSASIWCPLVDVDEGNGELLVLPRSHRIGPSIRSVNADSLVVGLDHAVARRVVRVPARAGETVVYLHDLFHGSGPNRTSSARPAVAVGVLPRRAKQVHYQMLSGPRGDLFEEFAVGTEFLRGGVLELAEGIVPADATSQRRLRRPGHRLTEEQLSSGLAAR